MALTSAGYLPPVVVERFAESSAIAGWIGKANREDLTPPVAAVRDSARAIGLIAVSKGRRTPTKSASRCREDPKALWHHIVGRLPLGGTDAERQAGWMAHAVVGSGVPAQEWSREISDLLFAIGWRSSGDQYSPPPADSPTLDVLEQLAGIARTSWSRLEGVDLAVATTARAAIRQP